MVSGSLSLTEMWPTFVLRGMPTSFVFTRWRIRRPAPIRLRIWASLNPTASYASWRDRWACEAQDFKSVHVNNCASGVVCESEHGFSHGVRGQSIAAVLAADQGQSPHYV